MENNIINQIFNKQNSFAVVGVSKDKSKYGRKIFDDLKKFKYEVYPINPKLKFILNDPCYSSLKELPIKPDIVIFVVLPSVVKKAIIECKELRVKKVWLQPGSESEKVINYCNKNNIEVLYDQCIMLNLNKDKIIKKEKKNEI